MAKYDIFISYSRKDFDEVNDFLNMLKRHIPMLSYCLSDDSEEFNDVLKCAIEETRCLLFAQSEYSLKSSLVEKEVMYAKSIGKKVVPLLLGGAKIRGWYMFKFGCLDFVDSANTAAVDKLIDSLAEWTGKHVDEERGNEAVEVVETVEEADDRTLFEVSVYTETIDENEPIEALEQSPETAEEDADGIAESVEDDECNPYPLNGRFVYEVFADNKPLPCEETEVVDVDYDNMPVEEETEEYSANENISEPEKSSDEITQKPESSIPNIPKEQPQSTGSSGVSYIVMIAIVTVAIFMLLTGREKYDTKRNYSQGLAAVEKDGKWGFVNKKDKLLVSLKYDSVSDFSSGHAMVRLNGKWSYVNLRGQEIAPIKYEKVMPFSSGRGWVKLNGKYGFIDTFGRPIVPPKYDYMAIFVGGCARVSVNRKWGVVDTNGKEVIPVKYDDVGMFYENIAQIKSVGKWGFVNKKGAVISYPKYDEVGDFSNERAAVMSGGKWGFIDTKGKEVIPLKYDSVEPFSDLITKVVLDGETLIINKNGKDLLKEYID